MARTIPFRKQLHEFSKQYLKKMISGVECSFWQAQNEHVNFFCSISHCDNFHSAHELFPFRWITRLCYAFPTRQPFNHHPNIHSPIFSAIISQTMASLRSQPSVHRCVMHSTRLLMSKHRTHGIVITYEILHPVTVVTVTICPNFPIRNGETSYHSLSIMYTCVF